MTPRRGKSWGEGWTSVLIDDTRIGIAAVRRRKDQPPQVLRWDQFASEGADRLAALKRLRGAQHLDRARCTTLLRHGQYQMLQLDAPPVPREERASALRWRIKEMVDFPVDRAGIGVLDIPTPEAPGRTPQVLVVAARHDFLAPPIQLFQGAKVDLQAIDIPELAQRNVAALFEEPNRALAFLAFDEDGGRLTFSAGGELYVSRHIDVSRSALAAGNGDLGGLYERVLLDVQRSLDNFDRHFSFVSLAKLVVAPVAPGGAFVDYLKANLYQPVEAMDLQRVMDVAAVPRLADPMQQADALLAIGAALREEVAA
jgi:MSHA biogenesis protein MshI